MIKVSEFANTWAYGNDYLDMRQVDWEVEKKPIGTRHSFELFEYKC